MEGSMLTVAEADSKKTTPTVTVCTQKSPVEQSRSNIRPSTHTEPAYFSSCRSLSEGESAMVNKVCLKNEAQDLHDTNSNSQVVSEVTQCNYVNNCANKENDCTSYEVVEEEDDSTTPSRPTILLYDNDDEENNIAINDANYMEQSRPSPNPQLSVCILDMASDRTSSFNDNIDNNNNNIISNTNNNTVETQECISTEAFSSPVETLALNRHTYITKSDNLEEQDRAETTMHVEEEKSNESKCNVLSQTTLPRCLTEPHYSLPYSEIHQPLMSLLEEHEQQSTTHCKPTELQDAKSANTFHANKPHYNNFIISGNNYKNNNDNNNRLCAAQPHRFALSAPNCMFEKYKPHFSQYDACPPHKSSSMHRSTQFNCNFNTNNKNDNTTNNNTIMLPSPCTNVHENSNNSQNRWHHSSESKELSHALTHVPHKDNTRRRSQREKQISYGYVTDGYKNMIKLILHDPLLRSGGVIPLSPPDVNVGSKRTWDIQLRKWRRALHMFDYVYIDNEESENEISNSCCNSSSSSNSIGNGITSITTKEGSMNTNMGRANTEITPTITIMQNSSTRKAAVIEAQRQQWVSPNFAHVSKAERVKYTLASLYEVRYSHLVPHKIPVEDNLRCILRSELCYESVRSVVPQSASSLTKGTDISPLAAGIKIHIAPSAAVLRQQHEQQLQHEHLKSILRSQSIPQQAEELVQGLTQSVMKRRNSESISRSPSPQICPQALETHESIINASSSPEYSPEMRHLVYSQSSDMCSPELHSFAQSNSNNNTELIQPNDHGHENGTTAIDHTHNCKMNMNNYNRMKNMINNHHHHHHYHYQEQQQQYEANNCVHMQIEENALISTWNASDVNSNKWNTHTVEQRSEMARHSNLPLRASCYKNVVSTSTKFAPVDDRMTYSSNQQALQDSKTSLTCTNQTTTFTSQPSPTAPLSLWEVKSTFVNRIPHNNEFEEFQQKRQQQEHEEHAERTNTQRMRQINHDKSKAHYTHRASSLEPPLPLRLLQREINSTFNECGDNNYKNYNNSNNGNKYSRNVNSTWNNLELCKGEKESLCKEEMNYCVDKLEEEEEQLMVNRWDNTQEHYWPEQYVPLETNPKCVSNEELEKALARNKCMTREANQRITNNHRSNCNVNNYECTCQSNKRVILETTSAVCATGSFVREPSGEYITCSRQVNLPQHKRNCGSKIENNSIITNRNRQSTTHIYDCSKTPDQTNLLFHETYYQEPTRAENQQQYTEQQHEEYEQYQWQSQCHPQRSNYSMYDRAKDESYEAKECFETNWQVKKKFVKPHYQQKEMEMRNNFYMPPQHGNNTNYVNSKESGPYNFFNVQSQNEKNELFRTQLESNLSATEYYRNRPKYKHNHTNNCQLTQQNRYASNQLSGVNEQLCRQGRTSATVQQNNEFFDDTVSEIGRHKRQSYDRNDTSHQSKTNNNIVSMDSIYSKETGIQRTMESNVKLMQTGREPQIIERFVPKLASTRTKPKSTNLTATMLNKDAQNIYHFNNRANLEQEQQLRKKINVMEKLNKEEKLSSNSKFSEKISKNIFKKVNATSTQSTYLAITRCNM